MQHKPDLRSGLWNNTPIKGERKEQEAVIHGVRHSWDLGYRSVLMTMEHLRDNFSYFPVVSEPDQEPVPWRGASRFVQDLWKSDAVEKSWGLRPGPDNTHIFLCGNPDMIESTIEMLA